MRTLRLLVLPLFALLLALSAGQAHAEARVFDLVTPNPDEIVRMLQTTYGDKVRVDIVQQRLVVVGSTRQLDEIATLLAKIDRPPAALRLTLRETPPPTTEREGTVVYSSGDDGRVIDTVEGAMVAVDYQKIVQQPTSNGWLVAIENQPVTVSSLTVQVQLQSSRTAQTKETRSAAFLAAP
jgi:antitoxin component of MazEF toxin-antitoxin module